MDRTDALLLALSLAGIAGLGWAAEAMAPPTVALEDLAAWEDRAAAVEAVVTRAYAAGSGAQVLQLADGTGVAAAFWSSTLPVEGARVRAEGTVARHRGAWEVMVRTLEVLAPPGAPVKVEDAARLAPALEGRDVVVAGALAWPGDGDPVLRGGGSALALEGPRGIIAPLVGQRVAAHGLLRYEPARAAFLLEAWEVRPA